MTTRLNKFIGLTPRHKLILAQAWFMLGWYRAGLLLLPFKRLTRDLQHQALPMQAAQLPSGRTSASIDNR